MQEKEIKFNQKYGIDEISDALKLPYEALREMDPGELSLWCYYVRNTSKQISNIFEKDISNLKIKAIEFGFENCEQLAITGDLIEYIGFNNIAVDLRGDANKYVSKTPYITLSKYYSCSGMFCRLKNNYKPYNYWGIDDEKYKDYFERLSKYNDIVDISIYFQDNSWINIYVPWEDDGDEWESTILQKTEFIGNNNNKELILRIGDCLDEE